jgi:FkbM family methyltransferase
VFIDMGANEAYFSVLASRLVGPHGTVVAVEPQSRLQSVIQTNLDTNGCSNVRLVRCVVLGRTDKARLSLAPDVNTGSSSLFRQTKYSLPTEEVQGLCLADFLDREGVENCDLMKVDIEGAEYDVFLAAGDVLRKGILKHVALEIHHSILASRGLSPDRLHTHMIDSGYQLDKDAGSCVYSFSR